MVLAVAGFKRWFYRSRAALLARATGWFLVDVADEGGAIDPRYLVD
jgi:hypothetical protein